MLKKRPKFKLALFMSPMSQRDLSKKAKVPEIRISQFIYGKADPSEKEKESIAKALNCYVQDIFPED